MKKNTIVNRFKKSANIEKNIIFADEKIDLKNNLTDNFIILSVKGQTIKLERNFKLSIDEQITSFKNRYKLSIDSVKKTNKKLSYKTVTPIQKKTQTNNTFDFFKD